jgi:putative glutamine amidotransferase
MRNTNSYWLAILLAGFVNDFAAAPNKTASRIVKQPEMKPLIGINASFSSQTTESANITVKSSYVDAVTSAGGIPVILPPVEDISLAESLVNHCDGFIFIGGPDINPKRYNEDPHPTFNPLAERRENYDFAVIEEVLRKKKPFLAVCLGHQEINVALGGTLIQDIAAETSSPVQHSMKHSPHYGRHDVIVEKNCKLHDLVGTTTLSTNTSHHQAVEKPGKGLRITSRCTDGTIESVELEDYPFGIGVQWHPEKLIDEKAHLSIFQGLIKAASKKDASSPSRRRTASAARSRR